MRGLEHHFVVPFERSFDAHYGLEYLGAGDGEARGRVRLRADNLGTDGTVQSGVYAAMAESLASQATAIAVYGDGNIAVGLSNHTSFMRPALEGHVHASARRVHRGSTTWVWEIELTDDGGRLCALSRVTMAVRPDPSR